MSNHRSGVQLSRRSFLSQSVLGAGLLCLPSSVFKISEIHAEEENNSVVLRFCALSDVHFKTSPDTKEVDRFRRAIRFMYDYSAQQPYSKFDALLIAGDVSDHGLDEELLLFKKTMDEEIHDDVKTIMCMGNHEFYSGNKPRWREIFQRDDNVATKVNGFSFIGVSPERGSCENGDYLYALDWYKKALQEAVDDDPKKPIFTFQHYHISSTVYGSKGEDVWGINDLYETLQQTPRVVNFSGHSHYPINDPRSIWQGAFTALGTGTLSYFEMSSEGGRFNKFPEGHENAAQMYVVEVRKDNSVVFKPYDLITNSFFDCVYYLPQPGNASTYAYTDARSETSERPTWGNDAVASSTVLDDSTTLCVSIPQASCPDVVHSYRIDLERQEERSGALQWVKDEPIYVWSQYYFKDYPNPLQVKIDTLPPLTMYRAKIFALNPWLKESERFLELQFTTPANPYAPIDPDAACPTPNMLDVAFVDGKPVNLAQNVKQLVKEIRVEGAPQITRVDSLNGQECASFNGKNQRLVIPFTSSDFARLGVMTISARFLLEKAPEEAQSLFSCTEGRGISLEINKDQIEFWASIDGEYRILRAPVPLGRFVDALGSYDGETLKLYLDGNLVQTLDVNGKLVYPTDPSAQGFCVGCDIARGMSGTNYFRGKIVRVQLFSWSLSPEQVKELAR